MYDTYSYNAFENENNISWSCKLKLIDLHPPFYEAIMEGRGSSFHVIVGPQAHGMFLCIPNWQIGCELSALSDTFWNSEQLSRHLNPIDTKTVITSLACLPKLQELPA